MNNLNISRILIATDFSELSESALKVGVAIAKRQNAEISLVHVVDTFSYLQPTEVFLPDFRITPNIIETVENQLSELAEKIHKETSIKISSKILDGSPAYNICRFAFEEKISLIVMGTHGSSGIREFFIGSEAFRVIKDAPCPVLTVPGNWDNTDFEKVIFPVRLKPGALEKYDFAKPIIEKNNSKLVLLGLADKNSPKELKEVASSMNHLKLQLLNDNVTFQSALCPCEVFSYEVIRIAKAHDADLIVITANLDYNFKAFFVGPYAQQVINHSPLPVLTIKPTIAKQVIQKPEKLKWGQNVNFARLPVKKKERKPLESNVKITSFI